MCVLFCILFCIYKGFFTPRLATRFISLLFFFSYMQSAYLIYFLQSFLVFLAERYLKTAFLIQIGHRLQEKTAKTKISIQAWGIRFIETLAFLEMKCYFTLFALRINMECSSSCISHFFAARPKCLKFLCRLKGCEDKGASLQSCKGLQ